VIYHESYQIHYYEKCFPWLISKARFIPFGVQTDFFLAKYSFSEESKFNFQRKYIICIGSDKRDWKTLIKAFEMSPRGEYLLVILGKKANTENPNILYLPFVKPTDMIHLIKRADFCILPLENNNYSFGQMTFLDQCILSKAIIASESYSLVDYGIDHQTCLFYAPGNVAELSNQIEELINNPKLKNDLGDNARKYVESKFGEKEMATKILAFLEEIMGK
jgi:glycosyltransferase involved in cell wall biosynthesis